MTKRSEQGYVRDIDRPWTERSSRVSDDAGGVLLVVEVVTRADGNDVLVAIHVGEPAATQIFLESGYSVSDLRQSLKRPPWPR